MATIQKFEDLICWQKTRKLANFIFDVTDKPIFKDFGLKSHIRKTAISPMSNIAEGFDRGTRSEFIDALFIAKGEVGEARCQLYLSHDRHYVSNEDIQIGLGLCDECSRLIQSFVYKVKGGSQEGIQFKRVQVKKDDELKSFLRGTSPDIYKKLYNE
jgi:four helix bundle protein